MHRGLKRGCATRHVHVTLQVHPILSLALVDLVVAILWIIGGGMWLRGIEDRNWCFAISLSTVVSHLPVTYAMCIYTQAQVKCIKCIGNIICRFWCVSLSTLL